MELSPVSPDLTATVTPPSLPAVGASDTAEPDDQFTPWGEFRSSGLEGDFRAHHAEADARLAAAIVVVAQGSHLLLINDYRLFGWTDTFWQLAAVRGAVLAISIAMFLRLLRRPGPLTVQRLLLGLCGLLVGLSLFAMATRPPGFQGHVFGAMAITLVSYALIPLPLRLQALAGWGNAAATLLIVGWLYPTVSVGGVISLAIALVALNLLGGLVSRYLQVMRREQFGALRREIGLRLGLEDAMREVRTLRGILPICRECQRVRGDAGEWQDLERYVAQQTDADFSNSVCPECLSRHYPDLR